MLKKRLLALGMCVILGASLLAGCGSAKSEDKSASAGKGKDIVMVWLPNESGDGYKASRDAIGALVEKATGKKVVHKLTTDYAIAVETMANNKAAIGYLGAQSFVEANKKNPKVLPFVVNSGASGTLKDAVYYSWLAVNKGDEDQYKKDGKYVIDNIQGKRFSFVSNSSTSGFKVPSAGIVSYFGKMDKWKNIKVSDLLEGGPDKFFSEVLFGGSHQGAAMNLLNKKVDVAAFCDEIMNNYITLVSGELNATGAVYKIKDGAAEPFNGMIGKEYVIIKSVPVLNSPMVMNTSMLTKEEQEKLVTVFTDPAVANNQAIFVPEGSKATGSFKRTKNECFVKVENSWFDPIRALSN
jgi:phosphonate transport system substrate-binding protein